MQCGDWLRMLRNVTFSVLIIALGHEDVNTGVTGRRGQAKVLTIFEQLANKIISK